MCKLYIIFMKICMHINIVLASGEISHLESGENNQSQPNRNDHY